ncbi:hypothetical protein [Haladaptatus sp. R4]|uniref:hypothetical protein n=1 Tax=Haladaptatus sp. R4 TaxID=1679489 RepID=UPI000AABD031|nr:hypothetical protein [Haladaptatus sp. R4]
MERRQFLERLGGVVAGIGVVGGVADGAQSNVNRRPVITSSLIREWTLEDERTDKTPIKQAGTSLGDAYTNTLIYRDAELASGLDKYVSGSFDGIVGAFMATRVTFDSPVAIFAQPSLVTGIAKRRFEETLSSLGFSDIRERSASERETTNEQAIAEYEAYYDASEYITRPNSPAYDLPSVTSDGRVKTVLYLEVLKPGKTLLITSGIRPTNRMLRDVFHRNPNVYRRELLRLMHSVK